MVGIRYSGFDNGIFWGWDSALNIKFACVSFTASMHSLKVISSSIFTVLVLWLWPSPWSRGWGFHLGQHISCVWLVTLYPYWQERWYSKETLCSSLWPLDYWNGPQEVGISLRVPSWERKRLKLVPGRCGAHLLKRDCVQFWHVGPPCRRGRSPDNDGGQEDALTRMA